MSINGKRNHINIEDLLYIADLFTIKNAKGIISAVIASKKQFRPLCEALQVPENVIHAIEKEFVIL